MFFLLDCLVYPQWEKICLASQRCEVPGGMIPKRALPLLLREGEGEMGEGLCKGMTRRRAVSRI